jgi:hypothetical protein
LCKAAGGSRDDVTVDSSRAGGRILQAARERLAEEAMEWVWGLYKEYVHKHLTRAGNEAPSDQEVQETFLKILSESTLTVLVQEPWQNSVRFRELARYRWGEMTPLLQDPTAYLLEHFGGGKFKLNFHQGWNFVATQNFKPPGEPRWMNLPRTDPAPDP